READRLARRPALVGVGQQDEVVACGRARLPEARRVLVGAQPSHLELHPGETLRLERLDLARDVRVLAVVAADRDHRNRVAVAAPEPPERLAERLAGRVPGSRVDAGAGDEAEAAVAQDVEGRGAGELPDALDREQVLAEDARRDLVTDDALDLDQRSVLVADVRLAD